MDSFFQTKDPIISSGHLHSPGHPRCPPVICTAPAIPGVLRSSAQPRPSPVSSGHLHSPSHPQCPPVTCTAPAIPDVLRSSAQPQPSPVSSLSGIPNSEFRQGGLLELPPVLQASDEKCDVLNRGFSGYNTRWARIILPRLIRKGNSLDSPVAVTIFFGANDSALKGENPKQHVPLEEYVANLKSMVQYLKSVDVPENRVILITPPPLCEPAWEHECIAQGCKLNRLNSVVGEYAHACLQVAKDCGTDVLDLWTLMQQDNQDFSSYLSDGLHLSPKGNDFLFSQLWPLVEKKVASLPLLLPYWRDVEEARPELSLLGDGDH
ncbi:Isoamyl acetate-hydrolyzing esterase 1 like protein [Tupaia chinensis]|uniref:Isoamyl acetate-hydrolyzing esterase 1 homolog n=1 Tax=Tupaia chinensis TaxID=246437 RepID=L9LAF1_TUPCH|nr:Isoamyl acetate-hydrolyzing esterase 1 like protein [Tupaia chinensis]